MAKNVQDQLNRMTPAARDAALGDVLNDVITQNNALAGKLNALLAKLDADAGVTDANYAVTIGAAATIATLQSRLKAAS